MSKTRKISLLVAIVAILAIFIVAFATDGYTNTVDCPDCDGGVTSCSECEDHGVIADEDANGNTIYADCPDCEAIMSSCTACNGENADCTTCAGYGQVAEIICSTCGGEVTVTGSFWALIPPIIAIALALITKEVYSSLFIGVLAGGVLDVPTCRERKSHPNTDPIYDLPRI